MRFAVAFALVLWASASARAATDDGPVYEIRVYYAAPGKLDALHARFRDHTCKLFEKHGIANVVYMTPIDNPDNKLIYFLSAPSMEAMLAGKAAFSKDPEWQSAQKASEIDG